jgi:hypothetical protein
MPDRTIADAAGWRPVGELEPGLLRKGRSLALSVAQWPARVANSYVAGPTWVDRMCLQWDAAAGTLVTPSFGRDLAIGLDLTTLQMWFLEQRQRVPHSFDPEGRSPAQAEAWILVELLHRGAETTRFSKALPYELPDLISGDAEEYSPQSCAAELRELTAWYHNASISLRAAAKQIGVTAPHITCNPQNLTLTCRTEVGRAQSRRHTVELGFSPGQDATDDPYFYVKPADGNSGAPSMLRATTISAAGAPQTRLAGFLQDAISALGQSRC